MKWTDLADQPCSISRSLAVIGDRWTLLILRSAFLRTRRFDDFREQIGMTTHVLANRLDKLVKLGVMEKALYQPWPARYEYRLTAQGRDLYPVLQTITAWGDRWLDGGKGAPLEFVHQRCGHRYTPTLVCSECREPIDPREVMPRPGPGLRGVATRTRAKTTPVVETAPPATLPVTAVVLAGGRGKRMKGQDKGLMPWRGRPLAATLIDALRPQAAHVLVNANRNLDAYAALGVPVVPDTLPGFQGPLAGMLAGLRAATTDAVLFVPCDTVRLPRDLVARLSAADARAAFASVAGEALYTCCLLRRGHADAIEAALREGRRAVRDFLAGQDAVAVEFPRWPAAGRNLNRPEDLDVAV